MPELSASLKFSNKKSIGLLRISLVMVQYEAAVVQVDLDHRRLPTTATIS